MINQLNNKKNMFRKQKLDSLLHQKIAEIIQKRLDAPLDILITIVKVDTSPDLENVKIFFSVLPDEKKDEALKFLIKNSKEIKKNLAKELELKKIPKLKFKFEETEKKAQEIEQLLDSLKKE